MISEKVFCITGMDISKRKLFDENHGKGDRSSNVANTSFWNGLHVISISFACGLAMSILTIFPRHNSIDDQRYWLEINIPAGVALISWTSVIVLDFFILIDKHSLFSLYSYFKIFLTTFLTWIMTFTMSFLFWTKVLKYNHPMPLLGIVCHVPAVIVSVVSLPIFFASDYREDREFKKKWKFFIWYEFCWSLFGLITALLTTIFRILENTDAQCIMAILIPISKRCIYFFFSKVMHRIVGTDNERANVSLMVSINFAFAVKFCCSQSCWCEKPYRILHGDG